MSHLWNIIIEHYRKDESACLHALLGFLHFDQAQHKRMHQEAGVLVSAVRKRRLKTGGINALMAEYDLSNAEGIALMCLAEALLRIPDPKTQDRLIRDKLSTANWKAHLGASNSLFVNAASFGLYLTGKMLPPSDLQPQKLNRSLSAFYRRSSATIIRQCIRYVMRILGNQFVMGETIQAAQTRALKFEAKGYRYSYDMLGEAARTDADAKAYLYDYEQAILTIGKSQKEKNLFERANLSIKLSALFPRYEYAQTERTFNELYPRVKHLCTLAQAQGIAITIDAEETDRLLLSLELIEKLALDPDLKNWPGLGLAVQAYQKRAFYVIDYLQDLAQRSGRRIMIRLVKGAYWDYEIKLAQEQGLDYPVFTRKLYTDVSYLACAKKILANTECFYPMFATHNALSVATILEMAGSYRDFEFQALHGMGETLYDLIVPQDSKFHMPCRIYAPVGTHKHLLAYLVRRLLENGANSSFVNRILDKNIPLAAIIPDPIAKTEILACKPHPQIPSPRHLYGATRMNSKSFDLSNPHVLTNLMNALHEHSKDKLLAVPMLASQSNFEQRAVRTVFNPANTTELVGQVIAANEADVEMALGAAQSAFSAWSQTSAFERAALLNRTADLLEEHMTQLMSIIIREAGKSIPNAISEIREAVDFCRYYASEVLKHFAEPINFPGVTGETNQLSLHGRGIFVCISPWNFPLAIFLGQITAALAAGNVVIAKPAEPTALIAAFAVELLHQAGFPRAVIQMLPGKGSIIGMKLVNDPRIAGVIFTGGTDTARLINRSLANRDGGAIVPLVAETGGQNAMVIDSSALPEQVVKDVLASSFDSAGQRCSALRVLFLPHEVADTVLSMLQGAMDELKIGNPLLLKTDIGPVINSDAKTMLLQHIEAMRTEAKVLHQTPCPAEHTVGHFVPPTLIELPHIGVLKQEMFGPILHIIRYDSTQLNEVIAQINSTGYGLTFGIQSRIQETVDYLSARIHAGNIYVNRNMIGAVVGVQPFGGEGLSGTGPKAGGPYYLPRLALERVISVNTTASGGNASLMSLAE